MIPYPNYLNLQEWADQVVLHFMVKYPLPVLQAANWQSWASAIISILNIDTLHINPYNFNTWQAWAERFIGVTL